jgi:hypothetical protein
MLQMGYLHQEYHLTQLTDQKMSLSFFIGFRKRGISVLSWVLYGD